MIENFETYLRPLLFFCCLLGLHSYRDDDFKYYILAVPFVSVRVFCFYKNRQIYISRSDINKYIRYRVLSVFGFFLVLLLMFHNFFIRKKLNLLIKNITTFEFLGFFQGYKRKNMILLLILYIIYSLGSSVMDILIFLKYVPYYSLFFYSITFVSVYILLLYISFIFIILHPTKKIFEKINGDFCKTSNKKKCNYFLFSKLIKLLVLHNDLCMFSRKQNEFFSLSLLGYTGYSFMIQLLFTHSVARSVYFKTIGDNIFMTLVYVKWMCIFLLVWWYIARSWTTLGNEVR